MTRSWRAGSGETVGREAARTCDGVSDVLPDGTYLAVLIRPAIRGAYGSSCWPPPARARTLDDINAIPDAFDAW